MDNSDNVLNKNNEELKRLIDDEETAYTSGCEKLEMEYAAFIAKVKNDAANKNWKHEVEVIEIEKNANLYRLLSIKDAKIKRLREQILRNEISEIKKPSREGVSKSFPGKPIDGITSAEYNKLAGEYEKKFKDSLQGSRK